MRQTDERSHRQATRQRPRDRLHARRQRVPVGNGGPFEECYGPTWGRHRARTRPAAGNHDYKTRSGVGNHTYFGQAAGPPGKGLWRKPLVRVFVPGQDDLGASFGQSLPERERRAWRIRSAASLGAWSGPAAKTLYRWATPPRTARCAGTTCTAYWCCGLLPGGFEWRFLSTTCVIVDTGAASCHR